MRTKKTLLYYSLIAGLVCVSSSADAGIRVGNLSRSNAQGYQQVNETRYNATVNNAENANAVAAIPVELPVPVDNLDIAAQVRSAHVDSPVSMEQLERCSLIYPNGEFKWGTPTIGRGAGGASTCTAVIELRAYQAGENGSDLVVARAALPAGESVRCNISDFPEITWLPAAERVEFPADSEPTMEDVISVMNREQKQDAGLKIAAGTLLFGIAGNIVGDNEPGKTGLLGGGKDKIKSTAIGARGGAALMVGHTQTGKVAGDTILSAGINATAGAVIGNMVSTGDEVLRIEDCKINGEEKSCLWGVVAKGRSFTGYGDDGTAEAQTGGAATKAAFYDITNDNTYICDSKGDEYTNCVPRELISISLGCEGGKSLADLQKERFNGVCKTRFRLVVDDATQANKGRYMDAVAEDTFVENTFVKIQSAKIAEKKEAAMIAGVEDKAFGSKRSDWNALKKKMKDENIYLRNSNNEGYQTEKMEYRIDDFYPMYLDSEDGGLIDFGNKARLKSTLTGAGVGGALGAFSGYQGAQKDIEERWVTAVREYKDSLQKIYCATGTRFLSQYNDLVTIPALSAQ